MAQNIVTAVVNAARTSNFTDLIDFGRA